MPVRATVLLAAFLIAATPATAAEIRLLSSGAPAEAERALAAIFAKETGHRVDFTFGTPAAIQEKAGSGAAADLVVLPIGGIEALEKAGILSSGSRALLARVSLGLAIRQGAALPDIATPEAVRKTLLEARSI